MAGRKKKFDPRYEVTQESMDAAKQVVESGKLFLAALKFYLRSQEPAPVSYTDTEWKEWEAACDTAGFGYDHMGRQEVLNTVGLYLWECKQWGTLGQGRVK